MLNQVVLVGRLKERENESIKISVPRSFKNEEGTYDNDFIKIEVRGTLKDKVFEYCKIDDLIGIKGHIESDEFDVTKIVAEKVTFLTSSKAN